MPETVLFAGKIVFLVVLYVFIFCVVRSSTRDLRLAAPVAGGKRWTMPGATSEEEQEDSRRATGAVATAESEVWTLAVLKSPCVPVGAAYALPDETRALAGRSSDMDILLDDTFVSAKHALFEVSEGSFSVEDLRSTNGTLVNGTAITEATLLKAGDRIAIGDTVFEVRVH